MNWHDVWYTVLAKTNTDGAFCFLTPAGQQPHITRYGQSAPYVSDVSRPAVRLGDDRQIHRGRFIVVKKIEIVNNSVVTLVDDEDFQIVNQYKWYLDTNGYVGTGITTDEEKYTLRIHRLVMRLQRTDKVDVDHINGNKLDNQRCNLRICTRSQNIANSKKHKDCSSKFKGVTWAAKDRKWKARIRVNYERIYLGNFDDEIEAAQTYDKAALKYFGPFARINGVHYKAPEDDMNLIISMPRTSELYTPEYLSIHRVALYHIIHPRTKKTFCGRNANDWLVPFDVIPHDKCPTVDEMLSEIGYCKICQRLLSIWIQRREAA